MSILQSWSSRGGRVSALALGAALTMTAAGSASASTFLGNDSLVISETTYSDVGAVAALVANSSQLPGANAGQSVTALSGGGLSTVFNNSTVDPSFGVTSAITLQDLNVSGTSPKVVSTLNVNPSVVSTSFSSKSELSLNLAQTSGGLVLTFMGYNGGGVGNLDVSNSDTTAYKDTTNPVTSFFAPNPGQTYAYNRDVVAVGAAGSVSTTQTLAYGGNNGRSAVLAPNGLYYTVGNSNNGSGTPKALTTTTGLEVVTPGTTGSTMVDPSYASVAGDKAGKDSNFRGLTYFDGNLYFTKGSGSNGIDTVYEVSNPGGALPTSATASSAQISILPGMPTDLAASPKKGGDGGSFTPFGLFFANADTLYVADEGTGNATDAADHAGLEKWSLVKGVWQLDYTLQGTLIGQTYDVSGTNSGQTGEVDGVETTGLRDLTGRVNPNGTVTLYAVTATSGGYADTGADPNEIVQITDTLGDKTLPAGENFTVVDAAQYGVRYGGVAFNGVPEPASWALMLIGLGALGGAVRSRRREVVA